MFVLVKILISDFRFKLAQTLQLYKKKIAPIFHPVHHFRNFT